MPANNFKLFDENKQNMLSDQEYQASQQRLGGVQAGIASSMLNNKFAYQMSLIAYAIAQMMNANGYDATDALAVSAFVGNLSNSVLQKVIDKATTVEAQAGTNTIKWMTPALVKSFFDYRLATQAEAQAGMNNSKWMSPLRVAQAMTGVKGDVTKLLNAFGFKLAASYNTAGSRNWVPAAGQTLAIAVIVGAGGGGGSGASGNNVVASGGCGGGGGYVLVTSVITVVPGTSYPVVVGTGGNGGARPGVSVNGIQGGTGGSSSFNGFTAFGGQGGLGGLIGLGHQSIRAQGGTLGGLGYARDFTGTPTGESGTVKLVVSPYQTVSAGGGGGGAFRNNITGAAGGIAGIGNGGRGGNGGTNPTAGATGGPGAGGGGGGASDGNAIVGAAGGAGGPGYVAIFTMGVA